MSSNWLYCTTSVLIAAAGRVLVEVGLPWTTVLSRSSSHGSSSSYVGVSIALGVSVHEVEVSVEVTRVPLSTMIVVGAPSYAVVEVDEPPFAGMKPGPITLIG
jgi:hypothetical protein